MKKLLFAVAVLASALGAMAQGTINFKNSGTPAAPVYDTDGTTRLGDASFVAQIYWSASATGTFAPVLNADGTASTAAALRTGTGAGFWNAGTDSGRQTGVAAGGTAFLQVRVWSSTQASFAVASATAGQKVGQSTVFSVATGGSGSPPSLPSEINSLIFDSKTTTLQGIKLYVVPEPSTIALGLLGAGALLLRRRK